MLQLDLQIKQFIGQLDAYADGVRISDGGKLIVPSGATESITVTATSIYDNTVSGTATITVA